jgi:hypothetical protein
MKKIIILTLLNSLAFASVNIPQNATDLKITIYNNDRAFVNERRTVEVEKGKQKLVYEGVPSSVITQSVIPTFTNINTTLYSQNFVYDLISLNSMLQNSIDKEVNYYKNHHAKNDKRILQKGRLLAINPILIKNNNGQIISLNNSNQIVFSKVPKNMITKPSLVWNTDVNNSGKLDIDLKYLTKGISWKSDFVLNLSDASFDLNGWITINNNSGTSYKNADISVIAGDVNKVKEVIKYERMYKTNMMADSISSSPRVKQEAFSGYHLYKIPFKENINNKEQKQITFLENKDVKYKQYGVANNTNFGNYGTQKLQFISTIEFKNSKENKMGIPLPSGIVRMYKKSSSGQTHFIGEEKLKNTAKNEIVKLKIGKLFDVVGDKKIIKYKNSKNYQTTTTQYKIRNQGEKVTEIRIKESIPRYGNNIKLESSCNYNCRVVKKDAFHREFIIKVKPNEEFVFTSTFEIFK